MTIQKRILDLGLAILLSVILLPIMAILLLVLLVVEGRPLFYISERMKTPQQSFQFVKLRTMRGDAKDGGVTGGDKSSRIGPVHRILRRTRLDEIPQLWNVLKGDMSFVGPRPPLRVYAEAFPEIYGQVLRNRPGITGLASLIYHKHEEDILAQCETSAKTDRVYRKRCIPAKARLDLIYQRHATLCFDLVLIWRTATKLFRRG